MNGFITYNSKRGKEYIPISKIVQIGIEPYTYHGHDNKKTKIRWYVKFEIDAYNQNQQKIYIGHDTESEAQEYLNKCLKQIAEWQNKGVENEE